MRVVRHRDAASFLGAAEGFLAAREALHNLPLGVVHTCLRDPTRYPGPNLLATVEDGGRLVGVAVMTPPHTLLYYAPAEAAPVVAAMLEDGSIEPPGVHGPAEAAEAFATLWCARRGRTARLERDLRAYALDAVLPAPPTPGRMRAATEEDLPTVAAWNEAFHAETGAATGAHPPSEIASRAIREGRSYLWEDEGPVAHAVDSGRTTNGARVGAVYTPPAHRRRGYATALVAALSGRLLAGDRRFCFLFTDLANPTSNSIYPKIGYRPVADFKDFDFA